MLTLPDKIKATLERLKKEYKFFVSLKKINGKYYLYKQTSAWNKETKKLKVLSTYLGRILDDGVFIKKEMTKDDEFENAKAIILAHGGNVSMPNTEYAKFVQTEDEYENKILLALSTDARISITELSKNLGLSYNGTLSKIRKIEEKYQIKYTIEYGFLNKFNLHRFLSITKFTENLPNPEEIQKLLEADPRIQLAIWMKGEYQLILFIIASTPTEVETLVYNLRSNIVMNNFPSEWYVSYFTHGFGFIPLRDEFFNFIKKQVWQRTKETPRKKPDQIFYREYATMRELNSDGLMDFSEIDRRYGLNKGSARHTYYELLKNENIWRITIAMGNPPIKNVAITILKQENINEFNKSKKEYFLHRIEDDNSLLNKYIYTGDIGAPYGILLISPLYFEGELEKIETLLNQIVKGVKINSSLVSKVLVGKFGFRKIDIKQTLWYRNVKNTLEKQNP